MKKLFKKQSTWFWILQIVGWGSFAFFLYNVSEYSQVFRLCSSLSLFFVGLFSTSIFRVYIKSYIFIKDFQIKNIHYLIFSLLVFTLIFIVFDESIGFFTENILLIENENIHKDEKGIGKWFAKYFASLLICLIWTVFYVVVKLIVKSNQDRIDRLQLTNSLRDAQLNTLKGQINPHFMFNSLNNIRGLILEDAHKSREMITKLSDMLRYSLTKNDQDAILLEEELEMVDNYIALSKIQMEDRLQFQKNIDPNLKSISVPPMIIQLLIENAAKHGIANQKKGGIITLTIQKKDDILIIEVRNTGKLNIAKGSTQLGLKNIKQRLNLLYGEKASFNLSEINNEVVAKIKINEL